MRREAILAAPGQVLHASEHRERKARKGAQGELAAAAGRPNREKLRACPLSAPWRLTKEAHGILLLEYSS